MSSLCAWPKVRLEPLCGFEFSFSANQLAGGIVYLGLAALLFAAFRLCFRVEACVMGVIDWLWAAGALGIGLYMLAALLRPERF